MNETYESIKLRIAELYRESAEKFRDSPQGVGWKDRASHRLRLEVLSEIGFFDGCSILDVGCGYGALWEYLFDRGVTELKYTGIDLVESLISMAKKRSTKGAEFRVGDVMEMNQVFDFIVNVGAFNVKLDCEENEFFNKFVTPVLFKMWDLARIGVAVTFMTDIVDYRNPNLYYANPSATLSFLTQRLSRFVVLRHDYRLYEFTVYIYKRGKDSAIH